MPTWPMRGLRPYRMQPIELLRCVVEECPHFRRHVSAAYCHELHGQGGRFEGLQQPDESPLRDILYGLVRQYSRDATARARSDELRLNLVDQQTGREPDDHTALRAKAPFEKSRCRRTKDRLVSGKVGGSCRSAPSREVLGACDDHPADFAYSPDQQRGIHQRSDPDCDIQPFVDQIEVAVMQNQLHLGLAEPFEKSSDQRSDVTSSELHRGRDSDEASNRCGGRPRDRRIVGAQ